MNEAYVGESMSNAKSVSYKLQFLGVKVTINVFQEHHEPGDNISIELF